MSETEGCEISEFKDISTDDIYDWTDPVPRLFFYVSILVVVGSIVNSVNYPEGILGGFMVFLVGSFWIVFDQIHNEMAFHEAMNEEFR